MRFRQGRKVPNTLYEQLGNEPSDDDRFIGSCVSGEAAARLVEESGRAAWWANACEARDAEVAALRAQVAALQQIPKSEEA